MDWILVLDFVALFVIFIMIVALVFSETGVGTPFTLFLVAELLFVGFFLVKAIIRRMDQMEDAENYTRRQQELQKDHSGDMPDAEELVSAVRDLFYEMQKEWREGDLSGIEPYFYRPVFERFDGQLRKLLGRNAHPFCEHDEPRRVWISRNVGDGFIFDVSLDVDIAFYYLMNDGTPFPNQNTGKQHMRYSFTLRSESGTDVGIRTSRATYRVYDYKSSRI